MLPSPSRACCFEPGGNSARRRRSSKPSRGAARDEEWQARLGDARSTDETLRAGKPVTGVPTLAEMLDPKVVGKLCEWLKLTAAAASPPTSDGPDHTVVLAPASSFHPEPVRSAWEGRVPLGMVTLIVGVPGKGKSTLTV